MWVFVFYVFGLLIFVLVVVMVVGMFVVLWVIMVIVLGFVDIVDKFVLIS